MNKYITKTMVAYGYDPVYSDWLTANDDDEDWENMREKSSLNNVKKIMENELKEKKQKLKSYDVFDEQAALAEARAKHDAEKKYYENEIRDLTQKISNIAKEIDDIIIK